MDSNNLSILSSFWQVFANAWWIILPVAFYYIFKIIWMDYAVIYSVRSWHRLLDWTVLEIIPPREIEKGPKLMESIFTGITGVLTTPNTFDKFLKGAFTDRFSLELVGEEGQVHFYIRTQKKYRNMVEAQIYAQYPDAEISEVPDYTARFPKVIPNKNWDLWGTDFEFLKDPVYPIKTYDKFEESVSGEMIDPMAAMAEVLGALPPGQHIWMQYIIEPLPEPWNLEKAQKKVIAKLTGREAPEPMGLLDHLGDVFSNLFAALWGPVEFKTVAKKEESPLEFRLTPVEKDVLKAVEENLGRNFFKTKMRLIYLGRKDGFDKSFVSSFVGTLKQFNDINMNQIKPNDISKTYSGYLFKKARMAFRQRRIYTRYKNRNLPDGVSVIFSTKELATVFHFPDMGVKSPAVPRIASKMGTAPANLPIQ